MTSAKQHFQRLPTNVVPKNYKLTLKPNLTEFNFIGEEVIDVEVREETNKVVINCLDITVKSASFSVGELNYHSSNISHCTEDETVAVSFPLPLPVGRGLLSLNFTGELNDKLKGFYRCKYTGEDGSEKFCAVTHFEPTGARRAFPCWDEPTIRATFDITLIVPKDRVALSNMNVTEEKDYIDDASLKVVKFARSPIMSTYLVAFVVGEFDFVEGKDADDVNIRVYTAKGKASQGQFALEEWWTHLWLKEGFASWIEYLLVDYCFPEFDVWTQFVSTELASALKLDSLRNSHPIEVPVGHPGEIEEIFDAISYNKGASIIRMLHQYVGDQDFRKGLNHYLKKFEYSAASTDDLWASLCHASSKPVAAVMDTWTKQMGFPVLSVAAEQKGESMELTISQRMFSADRATKDSSQWKVPVAVCTSASPVQPVAESLLEKDSCTVVVLGVGKDQWVKLNPGQVGFYRVQYSSAMLELLLPAINDSSLPPRDRLGLQSDLFALARAGLASITEFLKVAEQFRNETNYTVWNDLASSLSNLGKLLQNTGFHSSFQSFCVKLFEKIASKVGWDSKDGEGHLDALLRGLVLGCMGHGGDPATIAEARKRFDAHCRGETTIPADLRSAVYSTVLKHGDDVILDAMMKLFREADLHEEKVRLMRCMGAVSQPELIKKVLDFSMTSEVRSQDTVFVIAGVTGSLKGRDLAWQFLQDNWEELYNRYASGLLLPRLIQVTTDSFATEKNFQEIQDFFSKHSVPNAERTVQQSLEKIRLNITWLSGDSDKVRVWLQDNGY